MTHLNTIYRILKHLTVLLLKYYRLLQFIYADKKPLRLVYPSRLKFAWRSRYLIPLFTISLLSSLWLSPATSNVTNTTNTIYLPLSTQGAAIIDAKRNQVLLRGVNWFGIETELHAPHGLWVRDYKAMLAQIKSLGYNTIRLPYSVESLKSTEISGIDYKLGANAELQGKTPLEVMDCVIQEAQRQGLLILLDSHRLNDQRIPELWYGDGFTEKDWIDTWKMLAIRYQKYTNVIGADLKNEPHGRASWGTNDIATDWRLAAERAGNTILAVNPNWLIVVEGVEANVPGQKLARHWQGGNLEGVRRYPVRLSNSSKLVYSPHEYGPGVYNQPWFAEPSFPNNLYNRWEIGFNYIATQKIAPILIGEFGGRYVDSISKEGIWQQQFVRYIQKHNLSFTYWSWNPNSGDTGGVLQDDWLSVNQPKQKLLSQLLDKIAVSVKPAATTILDKNAIAPNDRQQISPQLSVATKLQSDWQTGFCVNLQVSNRSQTSVRNWQIKFQMPQATISNLWNASFTKQGSDYVLTPFDWGKVIEPNQARHLGFCAASYGKDYQPQKLVVSSQ